MESDAFILSVTSVSSVVNSFDVEFGMSGLHFLNGPHKELK